MLDQYHLDQNYRVCSWPSVVMAIVWIKPLIQPVIIHHFLYLSQQMILRHQCVDVYKYHISPRVFFPFVHDNTPTPILPEARAFG